MNFAISFSILASNKFALQNLETKNSRNFTAVTPIK